MKKLSYFLIAIIFFAQSIPALAADTTSPTVPRGFDAAGGSTPYEMVLTWTNPADTDLDHINVYLSTTWAYSAPNVWATVAAQPSTKGTYTITGLTSGTTYYLYIAAIDSSGNKSSYTTEVSRSTATSKDQTSPAAVTNFTIADAKTDGALNLSWTNPANDDFFQVRIYRETSSDFTPEQSNQITAVFGVPTSAGMYTSSGLTNGQTYYYKIRTEDNRGNLQSGLGYPSALGTPTLAVSLPNQLAPEPAPTPAPEPSPAPAPEPQPTIIDGDLIRATDTNDIYIVKIVPSTGSTSSPQAGSGQAAKKFKRLILNPAIFNSYGHLKWSDVKEVSQATMDSYTTSTVVQEVNADGSVADSKVYSITSSANADTGEKHWINMTGEQFVAAGYDWDAIYKINHLEASASFYPMGGDIK